MKIKLLARDAFITTFYQFQTENGEVYVEQLTTLSGDVLETKMIDENENPIEDKTIHKLILNKIDELHEAVY